MIYSRYIKEKEYSIEKKRYVYIESGNNEIKVGVCQKWLIVQVRVIVVLLTEVL